MADALKKQHGFEIDRKKIGLVQPIKRLGTTEIVLDLHQNVDATVQVVVFDPDAPVAAPAEEAAETEEQVAIEA